MTYLKDAHKYVVKDNVPVLDEHDLYDDQGKVLAHIDEGRLRQIIRNNNRRIKETGDEVPLIIGHTRDHDPEHQQPEIVGYATNFRLGRLFKTGRKAILATFKFFRDKKDLINKYPRRSVELWLRKWEIDPISLLGASTPERNLGLLRFSRQDGLHYSHPYPSRDNSPMDTNEIVQQVLAALQQTDVWQFIQQLMNQEEGSQGEPAEAGPAPAEDEAPPDDQGQPMEYEADDEPEQMEAEDDAEAYAAMPSGSNTFAPSMGGKSQARGYVSGKGMKMGKQDNMIPDAGKGSGRLAARATPPAGFIGDRSSPGPKMRGVMSRAASGQARTRMARQESQMVQMSRQLQDMRLRLARAEREADLIQLESEGLVFDRAEELEDLIKLTPAQYKRALEKMRKRYSRSITSDHSDYMEHSRLPRASSSPRSKEQAMALADKALRNGQRYEDVADVDVSVNGVI